MRVTITTDASFYSTHKMGGYAYWIKSNIGLIKRAGAFKDNVETPTDGEFKSIINSLYTLKKHNWNATEIYINTDSMNVIHAVTGKHKNIPNYTKKNLELFNQFIVQLNSPKVFIRHVKAHLHTNTPRHYVNQWCDNEAKKAARKKIFGC